MRIIRREVKEIVEEVLNRSDSKKGIIVELVGNEVIVIKDNGRYDLRMADERVKGEMKFENIKCFDFESEFWNWFENWYNSGEYKEYEGEEFVIIEEVIEKIENGKGKGILISVSDNKEVRFIKELLADGYKFYKEMTLWTDSGKDSELENCKNIEEVINRLIDEGKEVYYFENYKDFVKWVVNYWSYLR